MRIRVAHVLGQFKDRTTGCGTGQRGANEFPAWPRSEGEGVEVSRSSAGHRGQDRSRGMPRGHYARLEGAGLALLGNTYFTYLRRYRRKQSTAERRGVQA